MPPYTGPSYSPAGIRELIQRLQPYQLTKSEVLMILNLRPMDLGLLDCIVEECDERISAEEQEELLRIISDVLCKNEDKQDEHTEIANGGTNGQKQGVNGGH